MIDAFATSALLLTVGTGDAANLETSLFTPLRKSIARGEWARIILLPSHVTGVNAEALRASLDNPAISIRPLPKAGAENDADACFDHFDQMIEELRAEGFAPDRLVVDFTRGTKAMSAALVLAATRHDVPRLRYVSSEQRDVCGMVVAGTEQIRETTTGRATARRTLDAARLLVDQGSFAAALALLPDPENRFAVLGWRPDDLDLSRRLRPLIRWLAAWDRLDYAGAKLINLPSPDDVPVAWRKYWPASGVSEWVAMLARRPPAGRQIAIDLWANAGRRVAQGQFEDALVRAYRLVELIARARLADRGMNSEDLPITHHGLSSIRDILHRRNLVEQNDRVKRGREAMLSTLEILKDQMAKPLQDLDRRHPTLRSGARNASILIHGDLAQAGQSAADWGKLLADIEALLRQDAALRFDEAAFERDRKRAQFPMIWDIA